MLQMTDICLGKAGAAVVSQQTELTEERAALQAQALAGVQQLRGLLRAVHTRRGLAPAPGREEGWKFVCAIRCHTHPLPPQST